MKQTWSCKNKPVEKSVSELRCTVVEFKVKGVIEVFPFKFGVVKS
jgi:hypothetical protein